tara:strand:- start:196 stop:366 length:171 start_codon:yes stop_codon:yes gene_type:complete
MKEDKDTNIKTVIDILRSNNFYGGGKNIEIAKGKHQMVSEWGELITKIKRLIKAKR